MPFHFLQPFLNLFAPVKYQEEFDNTKLERRNEEGDKTYVKNLYEHLFPFKNNFKIKLTSINIKTFTNFITIQNLFMSLSTADNNLIILMSTAQLSRIVNVIVCGYPRPIIRINRICVWFQSVSRDEDEEHVIIQLFINILI